MSDENLAIEVQDEENATVVTFTSSKILDEREIQDLQVSIMGIIAGCEELNLILNFSKVEFLSSSVLGLLIKISKSVYEQHGQLRLCGIIPRINEIFKITRLNKIFEIYPNVKSAVASLSG